jgi:hypothetical protein
MLNEWCASQYVSLDCYRSFSQSDQTVSSSLRSLLTSTSALSDPNRHQSVVVAALVAQSNCGDMCSSINVSTTFRDLAWAVKLQ